MNTRTELRFFDGRKAVKIDDLPDSAWKGLGDLNATEIDRLYSFVSWFYRCVDIRANAVASMPYEIRRNDEAIYSFDGMTGDKEPPDEIKFVSQLAELLKQTEAATVLQGKAYWERRTNISETKTMQFDWLLPSSIDEKFSRDTGELLGFERQTIQGKKTIPVDDDIITYFWLPDYAVEQGPAVNFPGKAAMLNAGVLGNMDFFLDGYFARGMVAAQFIKYTGSQLPESEKKRVKEWFNRLFNGVRQAFNTEVVRGDFEVVKAGDGIADLSDNALTDDERQAIATGLGVPQSKLSSNAANFATKKSDDVMFIEDTIIPEVAWIYAILNEQIFFPLGLHIVALPQQLRVMQHDEVERSQALRNYVESGLSLEAAISTLGITVPEDMLPEDETRVLERQLLAGQLGGVSEEAALAAANQEAGADPSKILLNGIQIQSALSIIEQFGTGLIDRENAINMYEAFLGIDPAIGKRLIPEIAKLQAQAQPTRALDYMTIVDKRDERDRLLRWIEKRDEPDIAEFKTTILTEDEKTAVYNQYQTTMETEQLIDQFTEAMGAMSV